MLHNSSIIHKDVRNIVIYYRFHIFVNVFFFTCVSVCDFSLPRFTKLLLTYFKGRLPTSRFVSFTELFFCYFNSRRFLQFVTGARRSNVNNVMWHTVSFPAQFMHGHKGAVRIYKIRCTIYQVFCRGMSGIENWYIAYWTLS